MRFPLSLNPEQSAAPTLIMQAAQDEDTQTVKAAPTVKKSERVVVEVHVGGNQVVDVAVRSDIQSLFADIMNLVV